MGGGGGGGGLVHKIEFKYRFRETFKLKCFFGVNFADIFSSVLSKSFL